jgi:PBSX family phage portal protein
MKKNRQRGPSPTQANVAQSEVFSFGDAEVLDRVSLLQMLESVTYNGQPYYAPPISYEMLAKAYMSTPYHSSPLQTKRNILCSLFVPNKRLSAKDFRGFVFDDLVFGNAYLERVDGRLGAWSLKHCPAKYTRRGTDLVTYYFLPTRSALDLKIHAFGANKVYHLMQTDFNQEIYGVPEYLAALSSAWLNEAATIFRRRFYSNGSHAGSIIYVSEAETQDQTIKNFVSELKRAKEGGNFKNLFVHLPNGDKDGIKVIPLSEATGKDEFFNIKNVTRDDMLAAHRVPPALMSIIPTNTAGFGDVTKSAEVFYLNELVPLMARLCELNEWVGEEVVKFKPFALPSMSGAA